MGRSFDDEWASTVDNDVALLNAALFAIGLFSYVAISDWQDGCVGSRVLLTFGGVRHVELLWPPTSFFLLCVSAPFATFRIRA